MSTAIGYARVSTTDQDLALQHAELKAAGCTIIRSEKLSGGSRDGRAELQTVLDFLHPGDVVTVVRLDRLGRDTRDVLNIVHEIEEQGASLRVLSPAIDTTGPTGKIVLTVLGMVAQMERQFIRERQRTGIEAAKAKGVYRGGKAKIDLPTVDKLKANGKGMTEIARHFGVTRQAVYKAVKEATKSVLKKELEERNEKGRAPTARAKSDQIKVMDASGMAKVDIARHLGIGVRSVFRVLGSSGSAREVE